MQPNKYYAEVFKFILCMFNVYILETCMHITGLVFTQTFSEVRLSVFDS